MKWRKHTLCVDFDGVLHLYLSPWQGPGVIADGPVPDAMAWLLTMLEQYDVCIYSSRSKSFWGRRAMKRWLVDHLARLYLTPAFENTRIAFQAAHAWGEPWTGCDEEDEARHWARTQVKRLRFPLFKPAAFLIIDDRALTFTGNFADFGADELKRFKPWNKRGADHADTGRGTGGAAGAQGASLPGRA